MLRSAWRSSDPRRNAGLSLPIPSYDSSFRSMSVHVRPETCADRRRRGGRGDRPARDPGRPPLHGRGRRGDAAGVRVYGHERLRDGARRRSTCPHGGPVTLHVRSNAPPGFTTTIWNGAKLLSGDHHEQDFTVTAPDGAGVYRVEIRATGRLPLCRGSRAIRSTCGVPDSPPEPRRGAAQASQQQSLHRPTVANDVARRARSDVARGRRSLATTRQARTGPAAARPRAAVRSVERPGGGAVCRSRRRSDGRTGGRTIA